MRIIVRYFELNKLGFVNWESWCRYGKVVMAQRGKRSSASLHCQKLEACHPGVSTASTVEGASPHFHPVHLIQAKVLLVWLPPPFKTALIFPFWKKKSVSKVGCRAPKGENSWCGNGKRISYFSTNSFRVSRKSSPKIFVPFFCLCFTS